MSAIAAQIRTELLLSSRQGEQLLVSLGIPLGILVFFSQVDVLPSGDGEPIDFLAPAVLALAVISTAMVSLGIGTGFERFYGVLKRLGATPLGRPRLIAAKIVSVLAIELVQFVVIVAVALALGWNPAGGWLIALVAAVLGTVAFAGLGLLLAGTLSGPLNLAVCNALYLVLLITGGIIVPFEELPEGLRRVFELLPAAALADVMLGALNPDHELQGPSWIVLVVWAVALPAAAARWFSWESSRR